MPATKQIKIEIDPSHSHHAVLSADGQTGENICEQDGVIIEKSSKHVKLVRTLSRSFFDTLRIKLEG